MTEKIKVTYILEYDGKTDMIIATEDGTGQAVASSKAGTGVVLANSDQVVGDVIGHLLVGEKYQIDHERNAIFVHVYEGI